MKLLYNEWTNALGWTLVHSIWQSMLIALVVAICLRLIPSARARVRYTVACGGLLLIAVSSLVTFGYLKASGSLSLDEPVVAASQNVVQLAFSPSPTPATTITSAIASTVATVMPAIVGLWALGFLFCSVRLFNGVLYTSRIRSSSVSLTNEWTDFIRDSATQLGIRRVIGLAESTSITAPVVIGYLKPVILIPVGMVSGLTTEQLETIFLHELAHIRRHDYLINLFQSALEAIFFFNPFVWILSGVIRKERECCCDDLVIRQHGGDRAYATALVRLAEVRLSSAGFALSLAADNNQLLYRIKRIMERSGKMTSSKGRFVIPAVLLLGALLCISWLGTGNKPAATPLQKQDTIPPAKKNSASYSRKSIITLDENGQPHEEVVESFEGDESLRPLLQRGFPPPPGSPVDPMTPDLMLPPLADTIPPFGLQGMEQWDDFARAFEENFRERFEGFDNFPYADSTGFMQRFQDDFAWPDLDSMRIPGDAMRALEELGIPFGNLEENLRDLHIDRFRGMDRQFQDFGQRTSRYQDVLREELVKDGYLAEGETIESLEWNNDKFRVNGKSIKEADLEKYNKINEQYLGGSGKPGKLE